LGRREDAVRGISFKNPFNRERSYSRLGGRKTHDVDLDAAPHDHERLKEETQRATIL